MKLHRVLACARHSWYHLNHSMETWIDLFWFSLIDILVFGLISSFFVASVEQAKFLVLGIILWEIVRIGQYTITVGILWEIWSKSFSSLFISPLTLWEFILGQTISGFLKSIGVIVAVSLLARWLFAFNLLSIGPLALVTYFAILFTFSVAAGIFVLSLIIRYGTSIQSLAWGLIFLVQPLSAIFYPVSLLPAGIRPIAFLSPVTYVMESARSQMVGQGWLGSYLGISVVLTLLYLAASVGIAQRALRWSKITGAFARMGN